MINIHQQKNTELNPLIPTASTNVNSISPSCSMGSLINNSNNTSGNNIRDNERKLSSKLKVMVEKFQMLAPSRNNNRFNRNNNRKHSSISLRSRDYKTGASGKKGFKVNIPTKFFTCIIFAFFLVPLMIGLIILLRIFFFRSHTHASSSGGNIHSIDIHKEGNIAVTENALDPASNTFEGTIKRGDNANVSLLRGSNDGDLSGGGATLDLVERSGSPNDKSEVGVKLRNDTSYVLEQHQDAEGSIMDTANGMPNVEAQPLGIGGNFVDANTNLVSSSTVTDSKEETTEIAVHFDALDTGS